MHRNDDTQQRIDHRLKIARGHLDKVIKMVEEQDYCVDIIHQNRAVQSALKEVDNLLLDNHLNTCVVSQIKEGRISAIKEIMEVFKKSK